MILKLKPAFKDYIWGGTKLRDDFGFKSDLKKSLKVGCCLVIKTAKILLTAENLTVKHCPKSLMKQEKIYSEQRHKNMTFPHSHKTD